MITFDDFKKIEIKTAIIKEVKEHPNADKLYVLTLDLGDEERQCVAGVRLYYEKKTLVGKQVAVITNLEPVTIRGIKSSAMILAAKDEETLSMVVMDKQVKNGLNVT
ncbi:hypothetical protein KKB84_09305 [bacterium]|nr:hypothetical protein [bacterium]MBU1154136.1 hypothetical protein [bacterium]MBU1782877.1 hypothetical protein [bacterium]MBU2600005.1 hypothetical protein [bacterium]